MSTDSNVVTTRRKKCKSSNLLRTLKHMSVQGTVSPVLKMPPDNGNIASVSF